jgi:hypothetical protein
MAPEALPIRVRANFLDSLAPIICLLLPDSQDGQLVWED